MQGTQPAPNRFNSMIVWGSLESQDGNQQVEVAFAETGDAGRGPSVLEKIFGIDIGETDGAAWGVPEAVLAALLGYGVEEIRLD